MIVFYLAAAGVGLVGTWYFNVASFSAHESYLHGWFANAASSSAAVDVLVVAVAASVFYVAEGRRLGMRHTWVLIPITFAVAAAFAFPLFLAWRELALRRASRVVSP